MQVTLNIPDSEVSFFRELIKRFHYKEVVKEEIELTNEQNEFVQDLKEALNDVELHQLGKKRLKTAKELLNEL